MKMSEVLYILSDGSNPNERYKVGAHTGNCNDLIARYITAIPEIRIHLFLETSDAFEIESIFKRMYRHQRARNIRGRYSEWYLMSLNDILENISKLLMIYNCPLKQESKFSPQLAGSNYSSSEDRDTTLVAQLEKEGIRLIDRSHGINFRKPSDIPPSEEFAKHRQLMQAMNRIYKRKQRKNDKGYLDNLIHKLSVINAMKESILLKNHTTVLENMNLSLPLVNDNIIVDNPTIIITPGFIMEIVN